MKRVLFSTIVTVLGIVALLSFKSHGHVVIAGSGLPSAALPGVSATSTAPAPAGTSTGAPLDPSTTPTGGSSSTATSSATGPAASFVGDAVNTRYGTVQVKVTVAGRKITNVAFIQLTAFDGRSERINSDAAPTLLQEALSAQSAQIDSVSGASYTSQGYVQSLQSALDQAGIK